jgi:hypothetical protein
MCKKPRSDVLISKSIRRKISSLQNKIKVLNSSIIEIQENCPHHNLTYTKRGSTGNWYREDSFWYVWKCLVCDKQWNTDQDRENNILAERATEIKKRY